MANYRMILVIIAIAIYMIRGMESAKKDELTKTIYYSAMIIALVIAAKRSGGTEHGYRQMRNVR